MSQANQIVHESETQRQFVRLQLPAHAEIDDVRFTVKDLSSAGMGLRGVGKHFKKGQKLQVSLTLPFADFTLDIDLTAEVQYIDKKLDVAGCRFIDLSQNKISILNHVIRSFMTGDATGGDEIIHIVSRENFVNVRKHNEDYTPTIFEAVKKYMVYGAIALGIIILSSFIISNIFNKAFTIISHTAHVQMDVIDFKAPSSGIYLSAIPASIKTVKQDDVIGAIKDPKSLERINIISPCNCYIAEQIDGTRAVHNNFVAENESLYHFIPQDSEGLIKATISTVDVHRLAIGTQAYAIISGVPQAVKGKIVNFEIDPSPSLGIAAPNAFVYIKTETPLSLGLLNRPAFVEFHL